VHYFSQHTLGYIIYHAALKEWYQGFNNLKNIDFTKKDFFPVLGSDGKTLNGEFMILKLQLITNNRYSENSDLVRTIPKSY
jgi:hypothetical protein